MHFQMIDDKRNAALIHRRVGVRLVATNQGILPFVEELAPRSTGADHPVAKMLEKGPEFVPLDTGRGGARA